MSLTRCIKSQDKVYQLIVSSLDLDYCSKLVNHHNASMKLVHRPAPGTNFPIAGMSVIYALREYLGGRKLWHKTVASRHFDFPDCVPIPDRWVVMALMDSMVRKNCFEFDGTLPVDLRPTAADIEPIAFGFKDIFGSLKASLKSHFIRINPTFSGSSLVGGADANMIIGSALYDIRTTAKSAPLTLDNIVQQIAYCLLDLHDEYEIEEIAWYYSRQQALFAHPLRDFIRKDSNLIEARGELEKLGEAKGMLFPLFPF